VVATRALPASVQIYALSNHHWNNLTLFNSFSPAPSNYAAFGPVTHSPAQEPAAIFLGPGRICHHRGEHRRLPCSACGSCRPHLDTPPRRRQKGLLGKEWEGTSCFHFLLFPARQGVGMAQSVSSRLNKMTAGSGDGSHFAGQLEELPGLASALEAGLHLWRGSSSICVIRKWKIKHALPCKTQQQDAPLRRPCCCLQGQTTGASAVVKRDFCVS